MQSVKSWCVQNDYKYRFIDDSLFEYLEPALMTKLNNQKVIATDIARLYAIRHALESYDRVVWIDADFLIFSPESFQMPSTNVLPEGYMLGREVWIQMDSSQTQKLKADVKVHNAFLLFERNNIFLEFYLGHALRLVKKCKGPMPPQFVGPKLLTSVHNTIGCPVMEAAGMLSPLVIDDLLFNTSQSNALNLMKKRSVQQISGGNLCLSLSKQGERTERDMMMLVERLIADGEKIFI